MDQFYISGSTPVIVASPETKYICDAVDSLSFTPCQSGVCSVKFTSKDDTLLTIPNTVIMPDNWTGVKANAIYEITVEDGVYGSVKVWGDSTSTSSYGLGPNILANLKPTHNTVTQTVDRSDNSITLTINGTTTYAGLSTAVGMQRYLTVGKRYRMHFVAEVIEGTPFVCMAIRNSGGVVQLSFGSRAESTSGEFSMDFTATDAMQTVTMFISFSSSTNGSQIKYSDIWIREIGLANKANDSGVVTPVNLYDPMDENVVNNKYISGLSSGTPSWTNNSSYCESGYIPVSEYGRLYIAEEDASTGEIKNLYARTIIAYDSERAPIVTLYPGSMVDGICYILPKNTAYVRIPIIKANPTAVYMIPFDAPMIDGSALYPVPYGKRWVNADAMKTHWYGKTWYAYGTSITDTSSKGKYPKYLSKFSGMNRVNKGIQGGGIGNLGAYSQGQVYDAICNITDGKLDADLITLETGANDVNDNVPLGTIYDTGTSTLAGCLNDCLRYLQTNTDAQIVVFCSPATTTVPTVSSHARYEWAEMVERICDLNRVHYIKPSCSLGAAKLASSKGSLYVVDDIHQTELGGYVYAETIWSELKDIPEFYTAIPHI